MEARISPISIHVPLAGNVKTRSTATLPSAIFLSTFPLRGTSCILDPERDCIGISIHVPLAGNVHDKVRGWRDVPTDFYPRSPCGERLYSYLLLWFEQADFYPRSPCGERPPCPAPAVPRLYFYPRSPCGERLSGGDGVTFFAEFLSTFPLRGTSDFHSWIVLHHLISIHVPLAGNVRVA